MTLLNYAFLILSSYSSIETQFPPISTFSIVARDTRTGELGVAVQSKFIAVGSVVPYAKAGVGAIASQAWGNPRYGPIGLELLAAGKSSDQVVKWLTSADPNQNYRQIAVLGLDGNASIFTGKRCNDWAGGKQVLNMLCKEISYKAQKSLMPWGKHLKKVRVPLAKD